MYTTSTGYKTAIKEPSRSFECRITIGNNIYANKDIVKIEFDTIQAQDGFSIGNTIAQNMDLTLFNKGVTYPSVGKVIVEIGLKIGNSIEYIPIGIYNIDDVEKNDFTVKLTTYDNMVKFETPYFSNLGATPTLQQVVNELATITGIEFIGTVPNYIVTKLKGYTCREVLTYVASVCGGNAFITRDGKFTIVYPTEVDCAITGSNYITYKREEETYKVGMVTCQNKDSNSDSEDYDSVNDENTISVGTLASDSMELTFENPWVTPTILTDIYNKLKSFSYLGYTMKWQGDLSLDVGDIVAVTDVKGITRKAYISANKLTYTGGLIAETSAKGENKNSNSFSSSGPGTKNIERLAVKLLIAERAIITKANIKDLQATNARIENLDVAVANIDTALINYAKVDQLDAVKANIVSLLAADATINNALINKAEVAQLNATNANISNLNATVGTIQTLISGNLTSANIQSLVLTSSKVTVDNGFIKNAMIESLDVTKINAGTINTNKISVSSADGGLVIAGATQQFKDSSGNVRLQLGQDATGNFNFILRASDGTTTLIDGYGIKANAIADKLIKTNMVADSAIGSGQINYSSFVTGMNAATNTNYIKASKVAIDLTGQSLDIAFSNMNTTISGVQTTANSANSKIDGLQIGGRNLRQEVTPTVSNAAYVSITDSSEYISKGNKSFKFTAIKDALKYARLSRNMSFSNGILYTLSCYVYDPNAYATTLSYVDQTLSATYISGDKKDLGNGYYKYTVTYRPNRDGLPSHGFLLYGVPPIGASFYISGIKIEVGNQATDWTPAPEDIDASIASVQTTTNTNTTSISAIQGQITTLISNTTITTGGTTTQLKDAYNGTVATVNSLATTIGEHTSKIDTANSNITSVTSKEAALEITVNSINATLTSTSSTVATHTTQISTANTNITTALNNASTAVTTANTATTTANTAKTTATTASTDATTAKTTATTANTTANTASTNASTALTNANSAITTSNTASTNASNALTAANTATANVATLTTTVSTVTSRVTAVELTTSGLTTRVGATETALTNLQVGGRNLVINSSSEFRICNVSTHTGALSDEVNTVYFDENNININDILTFRVYLDCTLNTLKGGGARISFYRPDGTYSSTTGNVISIGEEGYSTVHWKVTEEFNRVVLLIQNSNTSVTTAEKVLYKKAKLEKGNVATDWTPAPEDVDQSILDVKTYATTTINSNVSTINQTTDSISLNVNALQSRATTIETTLGNKADTTTVTAISNRTATLETSVTGINLSLTTLNSNVSSVTTTANAAKSSIDGLQIGGRNLLKNTSYSTDITGTINRGTYHTLTRDTANTNNNLNSLKVVCSTVSVNGSNDVWQNMYSNCIVGKDIVASLYIKGSIATTAWIRLAGAGATGGTKIFNINTSWTKIELYLGTISYSGTAGATELIYGFNAIGTYYINSMKLEYGTKSTDWTPAPEDIDASIASVQTYATTNITSLTSSVSVLQNQIALKVEQTQINTAVATLDGKITSTNSTVSSLQAQINVQAGLISSKVSQSDFTSGAIENILSGGAGTNLMIDTAQMTTAKGWSFNGSGFSYETDNITGNKIVRNQSSGSENWVSSPIITVQAGHTYTISVKAKSQGLDRGLQLPIFYDGGWKNYIYFDKDTNGKYITKSFTITPTVTGSLRVALDNNINTTGYTWYHSLKVEEGSVATALSPILSTAIGTTITQSPTEVMTAFNGISSYFQVSADGAKFGDLSNGAYTKMSQKGLEHVDSTGATPYFYLSFRGAGSAIISSNNNYTEVTIAFPVVWLTKLNGKIPQALVSMSSAWPRGETFAGGCGIKDITSTNITIRVYCFSESITNSTYNLGGTVNFEFLIIG